MNLAFSFSPDGQTLASGKRDINLWNLKDLPLGPMRVQ
jgi:hypothetical protein